jgi:hypothetical protein
VSFVELTVDTQGAFLELSQGSIQTKAVEILRAELERLDMQEICKTLMDRRDRLSYYRLMNALSHVSKTAESIAKRLSATTWPDENTRLEEVQLVAAQVKGNWAHEYVLRLAKIMASCNAAFAGLLFGLHNGNMILGSIVLAHDAFSDSKVLLERETIPMKGSLRKPLQDAERDAGTLLLLLERDLPNEELVDVDSGITYASIMRSIIVMLRQLATECPQLGNLVDMPRISSTIVRLSNTDDDVSQSPFTGTSLSLRKSTWNRITLPRKRA